MNIRCTVFNIWNWNTLFLYKFCVALVNPFVLPWNIKTVTQSYLSLCSFQVRVCWAASPWCCWWRCCGWRRCCCSCCTSIQHGGTVAEKRGVNVSKRVSSTRNIRFSVVSGWSTRRSTPWTSLRVMVWHQINIITPSQRTERSNVKFSYWLWVSVFVLPVIPGLEGFEVGLAPSSSSSAPLVRGPSINMSPSSISSHTPPIWRKWSSPPSEKSRNKINAYKFCLHHPH